jgi:microcystin-dependent protein
MSTPFLGEIILVGFSFEPQGWAFCDGRLLSIAQNAALFSLLGTQYGGDGQTTFGLPDLRSRVPISFGQSPGTSFYNPGAKAGAESVTISSAQMPAHIHLVNGYSKAGDAATPTSDTVWARSKLGDRVARVSGSNTTMSAGCIGSAGGGGSHENRQPFVALNYIIALAGIFPARS